MSGLTSAESLGTPNSGYRPFVPDVLSVPMYAVLTLIATAIALYFCFSIQISHASSSAVTVMIIANTDRAAMGQKSVARLIGNFIACVAINTIFSHFAQAPWMFLIVFALWMGLCVFVAVIAPTPSFNYAATLSAITVGVIAIQQTQPGDIFRDSVDRFLVVSIGIGSVWIVFGLIPAILNSFFNRHTFHLTSKATAPVKSKPIDWFKGFRAGLSTVIVVLVGCSFWALTTWSNGSIMFLVYGIFTANLIQTDQVVQATILALVMVLVAIFFSFICLFFMLPYVNGFPMLMVALSFALLPGFLIKYHPVLGILSSAFLSIVISLVSPANAMTFNVTGFMNEALAFVIGSGLAGITISLLLPSSMLLPVTALKPA
jgi:uncharacterized membrane protein YccC